MRLLNGMGLIVVLLLLALFPACGGSSTTLAPPPAELSQQAEFDAWVAQTAPPTVTADGSLPGIPLDRVASEGTDPGGNPLPPDENYVVLLGKDCIQQHASTVVGDALELGTGDVIDEHVPAFGMYKVSDLQDCRPVSLNVECIPDFGDTYWVAVADYTIGAWAWFGPVEIPEFQLNLGDNPHRFVTNLGNMYFLISTDLSMVALHEQTTVTCQPNTEYPDLPGRPFDLVASDGEFDWGVGLHWQSAGGELYFEVWRAQLFGGAPVPPGDDPLDGGWLLIGDAVEPHYLDEGVPPTAHFLYKVRAVNISGMSLFSNTDVGWRAESGPPPGTSIVGVVKPAGETTGVKVTVLGLGQPLSTEVGPDGHFNFAGLPPSHYLVYCSSPHLMFAPHYTPVELTEGDTVTLEFQAVTPDSPNIVYGFVEHDTMLDVWPPGYNPLPGTVVHLELPTGPSFEITSNEDGYFIEDGISPIGQYNIWAEHPEYYFSEDARFVIINSELIPPPQYFFGLLGGVGVDPAP